MRSRLLNQTCTEIIVSVLEMAVGKRLGAKETDMPPDKMGLRRASHSLFALVFLFRGCGSRGSKNITSSSEYSAL